MKTSTTLANFVAAMLLHPEEQKKIQVELDDVVHHGVLAKFKDRDSLPILDAAWRESMRLNPSTPLGTMPSLYTRSFGE
jgi:cytochrome P450